MKGAIAELCARTITTPRRKRLTNIGTSHHFLVLQKYENNSATVPKRLAAVRAAFTTPIVILLTEYGTARASDNRSPSLLLPISWPNISAESGSNATQRGLRLESFCVHTRLREFHDILQLTVDPQFNRKAVEVVVQTHPSRISGEMLNRFREAAMAGSRDGLTIKGDTQIVPHGLNPLMIFAVEPRQNGVTREIVDPPLKGPGNFDAKFCRLVKNR